MAKKGTILVECDQNMKDQFYEILPFTDGLNINFEDDNDYIQIQYELDSHQIDLLIGELNKKEKKEFRVVSHLEDSSQNNKEYDLARDISKLLNYDDDQEDDEEGEPNYHQQEHLQPHEQGKFGRQGLPQNSVLNANNNMISDNGSLGKNTNQGNPGTKGLKSKSSSFYPPNDPRSINPDDGMRNNGIYPNQPPKNVYNQNQQNMPAIIDNFEEIFDDVEDDGYGQRNAMGNPNHQILNQHGDPNGRGPLPGSMNNKMPPQGKNTAGMRMNPNQMNMMGNPNLQPQPGMGGYAPGNAPNGPRPKGPPPTTGPNAGYPQPKQPMQTNPVNRGPGGMMVSHPNDPGYYQGATYDDNQAMQGQYGRGKAKNPKANARYPENYGYEEEPYHNFNPNDFRNSRQEPPVQKKKPQPQNFRGGVQSGGYPSSQREEVKESRLAYGDMNANQKPQGSHQNPNMNLKANPNQGPVNRGQAPNGSQANHRKYPQNEEYYDDYYYEDQNYYEGGGDYQEDAYQEQFDYNEDDGMFCLTKASISTCQCLSPNKTEGATPT
jgi:hypothetical protein